MKILTIFLILNTFIFSIFATVYPSNSIGIITNESKDGYTIDIISDDDSILYKDEVMVKEFTTTYEGNIKIKSEKDDKGNIEIYKYSQNGNLIEYIDKDDNTEYYSYDLNNRLISSVKKNKIDEVINTQVYYRDLQSGRLLCIKNDDEYSFFKDDEYSSIYLVGFKDKYNIYQSFFSDTTITSNEKVNNTVTTEKKEDGSIIIKNNNKTIIYSPEGLLIENDGKKYSYNSNNVLSSITYKENNFYVTEHYDNSILISKDYEEHGFIVKKIIYEKNNIINELYEKGQIYAKITYDGSGEKVIEIEYF